MSNEQPAPPAPESPRSSAGHNRRGRGAGGLQRLPMNPRSATSARCRRCKSCAPISAPWRRRSRRRRPRSRRATARSGLSTSARCWASWTSASANIIALLDTAPAVSADDRPADEASAPMAEQPSQAAPPAPDRVPTVSDVVSQLGRAKPAADPRRRFRRRRGGDACVERRAERRRAGRDGRGPDRCRVAGARARARAVAAGGDTGRRADGAASSAAVVPESDLLSSFAQMGPYLPPEVGTAVIFAAKALAPAQHQSRSRRRRPAKPEEPIGEMAGGSSDRSDRAPQAAAETAEAHRLPRSPQLRRGHSGIRRISCSSRSRPRTPRPSCSRIRRRRGPHAGEAAVRGGSGCARTWIGQP